MDVIEEYIDATLVRVTECDCGDPGCERVFVICSVPERARLWLTCWTGPRELLHDTDEAPIVTMTRPESAPTLEAGLALMGLPFCKLTSTRALEQCEAWAEMPHWLVNVPRFQLWNVRSLTFGDDFRRVPCAVEAVGCSYTNEGLVPLGVFRRHAVDGPPDLG